MTSTSDRSWNRRRWFHVSSSRPRSRVGWAYHAWLYAAAKDGRIPSIRIGGPEGPLRVVPADLDAWIDEARDAWRPGDTSAATLRRLADAA
jgi:hypothetical protein